MNSIDVLKKERSELAGRLKALDSAIAALGGRSGRRRTMSAATRKKISLARKRAWAAKKAKGKA